MRRAFHDWILLSNRKQQMFRTESIMSDRVTQDAKMLFFQDWRDKLCMFQKMLDHANNLYARRIQNSSFTEWRYKTNQRQRDNGVIDQIHSRVSQSKSQQPSNGLTFRNVDACFCRVEDKAYSICFFKNPSDQFHQQATPN